MTIEIFDIKATINSKNKALINWKKHNFIYEKNSEILIEKILEIEKKFKRILLITSDCEETYNKLKTLEYKTITLLTQYSDLHQHINDCNKIQKTPAINRNKFDLIVSNLCLHRIDDVITYGTELKSLLSKNGFFICSFFGGKSLIELRDSLIRTDQKSLSGIYQRVIPYIDMIDACNLFNRIGFKEIVSDKNTFKIKYKKIFTLLEDINGIGENCNLQSRYKGLMTKRYLENLELEYKKRFVDRKKNFEATCDIIYLSMWNG